MHAAHSHIPPTVALVDTPEGPAVRITDQTLLPGELRMLDLTNIPEVCEAIVSLRVRGAPAIGCAAAAGVAMAAGRSTAADLPGLYMELEGEIARLGATRPTAVNLFWALRRMNDLLDGAPYPNASALAERLAREARTIIDDDLQRCIAIGRHGRELIPAGSRLLTHCNAGALATAGYGTALGVIRAAAEAGHIEMVWVDETRPLLQGARLTAWELVAEDIPCTVITDNMAASVMGKGVVDAVVVGADRITCNGDVANKIGTYGVAVLAKHHGIPFYVAAPVSTIDCELAEGSQIPIEERRSDEITHLAGHSDHAVVPDGAGVYNPAFDVTPNQLVTAIITEKGVARAPYEPALAQFA